MKTATAISGSQARPSCGVGRQAFRNTTRIPVAWHTSAPHPKTTRGRSCSARAKASSGLCQVEWRNTLCPALQDSLLPYHYSEATMEAYGSGQTRVYCTCTREGLIDLAQLMDSPAMSSQDSSKIGKAMFGPSRRMA